MCKYFSVYSISRMFVAVDIALVAMSGICYVVLIFAHGLVRERIVRAELNAVNATQEEMDGLNQKIETVYFPLIYSIGALGLASFIGLTAMVHKAVKTEAIILLRIWALIHGLLLLIGVAASIWIMDHDRRFGLEHLMLVVLLWYRLLSIMVIMLLSMVVRYTLEHPERPLPPALAVYPAPAVATPGPRRRSSVGPGLSVRYNYN